MNKNPSLKRTYISSLAMNQTLKNQVFRVVYDKSGIPYNKQSQHNNPQINKFENNFNQITSIKYIPLPLNIISNYLLNDLGLSNKRSRVLSLKLLSHLRLVNDDSGRVYFIHNETVSKSTIYELLEYFFSSDTHSSAKSRPFNANLFLKVLKKAQVPASWLSYVHIEEKSK